MATKRSAIRIKKANAGKLRKSAGAKKGQKLTLAQIRKLKQSKNPKTRARAVFAENVKLGKFGGKRKSKKS